MTKQNGILTVTLHPALDVSAEVDRLLPEIKLRCREARYEPGGGGVNVARVVREFGGDVSAFLVIGGPTGHWLAAMLENAGVEVFRQETEGSTRPSFHVLETSSGDLYRFVLPGAEIGPQIARRIEDEILALTERLQPAYLVVSGSTPPGLPPEMLGRIAARCRDMNVRLVADTSGRSLCALVGEGAYLVKPDEEELDELTRTLGWEFSTVEERARALIGNRTAEVVIVTLGSNGAVLVTSDTELRLPALPVEKISAVGAGDSFVAGLVLALSQGMPIETAFRHGMAAGAAAIVTPGSGLARRMDYERLLDELG